MNADKAQELFSDYSEGALSPSLRSSLERAMEADPALKAEYARFKETWDEVGTLSKEEIEVPYGLHDKIMARVDKSVFDAKREAKAGRFGSLRLAFYGAAAVVAVTATVVSLRSRGTVGTAELVGGHTVEPLAISAKEGGVHVTRGASDGSVFIKEESTGRLVGKIDQGGKKLDFPLRNDGAAGTVLRIEGDSESVWVALPGRAKNDVADEGTLLDLALDAADHYGLPVQIKVKDLRAKATWKLDDSDPVKTVAKSGEFTFERRNGLVYLTD
ncbi:MAG: hypothetical protein JST30_06390 [Armatimonadetes bacterium]|nr:hypothetical protein [Armatimonadota bacterium]